MFRIRLPTVCAHINVQVNTGVSFKSISLLEPKVYLKGINFREDLISRGRKSYISRGFIFANELISKISRGFIFGNCYEFLSNLFIFMHFSALFRIFNISRGFIFARTYFRELDQNSRNLILAKINPLKVECLYFGPFCL